MASRRSYDLIAAGVGTLLGLGVAYLMVDALLAAFATEGFTVVYEVRPQSLFVAFGLGALLTLAVVTVSAWRVSRLDITTAIRSLPSPIVRRARRSHRWRGLAIIGLGVLVAWTGISGGQAMPFLLGVSIMIGGLVPVARALGLGDRPAYTLGGVALIAWWLLPLDAIEALAGDLSYDFSVWIVTWLVIVLGATWTVMWNADLLLGAVSRTAGRVRSIAPVVRMAVVYPLRSRLRTSMTLAMFTLVVFTLVAGSTISGSFITAFDDIDRYDGGFDVPRARAARLAHLPRAGPPLPVGGCRRLSGPARPGSWRPARTSRWRRVRRAWHRSCAITHRSHAQTVRRLRGRWRAAPPAG